MDEELNDRGSWENAWQKALDDPAIAPSERVWQGLEHSLMEQELGRYKKRLVLYQRLAAASVLLLGLWAGWWLVVAEPSLQPAAQDLAAREIIRPDQPVNPIVVTPSTADARAARDRQEAEAAGSAAGYFSMPRLSIRYTPYEFSAAGAWISSRSGSLFSSGIPPLGVGLRSYYAAADAQNAALVFQEAADGEDYSRLPLSPQYLTAIKAELALQNQLPQVAMQRVAFASAAAATGKDKNKQSWQSNGDFWLGASMASTFFSPNIQPSDNGIQNLLNQQQPIGKDGQVYTANINSWSKQENSLPSVDFRLDAALRVRPRWMVQTSFEYGTYRVGTMAGSFYNREDEQNYPLYFSNFSYDRLQLTSPNSRTAFPIQAVNTYNFIRVPIGLNYILVDRTFGIALSSGISTDVFLGSKIADRDKRLQEYTIEAGNSSPFNRLHISGQLGLQLYYRAGHNYILTLEPSYRHALSDFSKSNSHFQSRPSNFGVAAGFRFILR